MYVENYALVQYKQGEIEEAIETLKNYLPQTKAIGDYQTFVQTATKLSSILIEQERFEEAKIYVLEGLKIAEEFGMSSYKCEITLNHAQILFAKNQVDQALKLSEEAFQCSENNAPQQRKAAKNLLNLYLLTQNFEKATAILPIYNELTERHFDLEQQKTYSRLEAEYQTNKKVAENELLRAQKIKNEATIKVQRIWTLSIFFLGLFTIGILIYAYRIKKNQTNLLEQKVQERTKVLHASYRKLEETNQELERSNEELERFAYIASHDLKQPLNTVISFSDLLHKKLRERIDNNTDTYLKHIMGGANQMKNLIEDILEYSKLRQEKRTPQIIDLNTVAQEVSQSLSALIEKKNAQILITEALPVIKYEKTQILLLFKNLIENGLKFNQSQHPIISISSIQKKGVHRLSFKDNGIGIEAQYVPKLFKMFSRLHNQQEYEGTGLGLSLCKKIVQNMGGEISIDSQVSKGSTFHIDIPISLLVQEKATML